MITSFLLTAAATAKSLQSCPTLCDPIDGSPPGPPSLGFSRQEHWSGLPFPSPICESEVTQLCLTLSDPMDCSLPGSSIHGIFQARVLEWAAIAFSLPYVWQSGNMWAETMACYYEWKPVMIQVTLHQKKKKKKNEISPQWWEVLCNMGKLPKRPWVSPPMQHAGGGKRKIWLYFVRFLQNPFRVPVSLFVPLKLEVMVR